MHIHGFFLIAFFTAAGVLMGSFLSVKLNYMGPIVGMIFGSYFLECYCQCFGCGGLVGLPQSISLYAIDLEQGTLEPNLGPVVLLRC
jgi:hypothetical protein